MKRGQVYPIWPPGKFFSSLCLFVYVDADVEPTVIPVGLVIAAPLAVVLHALYVTVHLPAVFAVLGHILIDPGAICFEPLVATFAPVPIRPSRSDRCGKCSSRRR